MEVKKIVEGMTAVEVAEVIDSNFKGLNDEKATKLEEDAKISGLGSNLGIIAGKKALTIKVESDNIMKINISRDIPCYGLDGKYYAISQGEYTLQNLGCLVFDINTKEAKVITSDNLITSYILLAFNDNGFISKGLFFQWYYELYAKEVFDDRIRNIKINLGSAFTKERIEFKVNEDLSVDVIYKDVVLCFSLDGIQYNIGVNGETYNIPINRALVYNTITSLQDVVILNQIPENSLLLAVNDRGYLNNGIYKPFWDEKIQEQTEADYNSKINSIRLSNLNIQHYVGYMNSVGTIDESATNFECLASDWISVKKGDKILYKGFGASSGKSWVIKNGSSYTSGEIDSVNDYTEFEIPSNGLIRFSSYRALSASRQLTLDVTYKDSFEKELSNIEKQTELLKNELNSKINSLSIPFLNIQHYDGYMNNVGDITLSTVVQIECLTSSWVDVVEGDVIMYKGYGGSSGYSWVLKDINNNYTNGQIDAVDNYAEIQIPTTGKIRFSSYRAVNSGKTLVLDVFYKGSLDERIKRLEQNIGVKKRVDKTMVNVGTSIWWLDKTEYADNNPIDGIGTLCKGYQTLLEEQFEFNKVVKYSYSGNSLGVGNYPSASIMGAQAVNWKPQENAIWTLDTIVNDFGRDVVLGTVDDYINNTGADTFYGALRAFKDRVLELTENPIVICSNALVRTDRPSKENGLGLTFEDYEKAMCYVASREGWYFVDQNRYGGINEVNGNYTLYDGLHPTNFGFRLAVKPWIEQINIVANSISPK